MAKVKNPVLSLGAKGSLGDAISFRESRSVSIAEKKPKLPYFLTLPVQYQRWLYEDYVYLWTQQSQAIKDFYRAAGGRHHLTAFQYWMKYQLTYLPDICGYWKLDDNKGATAVDSSRNSNDATVFGASPAVGPIDGCFSFDGINDQLVVAHSPSLDTASALSLDSFCFVTALGTEPIFYKYSAADPGFYVAVLNGVVYFRVTHPDGIGWGRRLSAVALSPGAFHSLLCVFSASTRLDIYINGILSNGILQGAIPPAARLTTQPFVFGNTGALWLPGKLDQCIYYNRALDVNDALRHAGRSFPRT